MEHSSSRLLADVDAQLAQWQAQGLLRQRRTVQSPCSVAPQVQGQRLLAFASNDYLGLANHPAIAAALAEGAQRWGAGSGASHVVSGHLQPVAELEEALAAFVGRAQALFFSSGYLANLAVLPALLERGDVVFHDKLNHASLIDAVRLGRAQDWRYPHGDMATLERLLQQHRGRRAMIVSDAVFSMDGDVAPLRQLYALACAHDAWLVLDDAHGLGVLGLVAAGKADQLHPAVFLVEVLDRVHDEIIHRCQQFRTREAQQTVVGIDELHVGLVHRAQTEGEFFSPFHGGHFKTFQT